MLENTKIDFMAGYRFAVVISTILFLGALGLLVTRGLNYGIDFKGGVLIEARLQEAVPLNDLRKSLAALDIGTTDLQDLGTDKDILIRLPSVDGGEEAIAGLVSKVKDMLGEGTDYRRIETVGPKVGKDLAREATWAVGLSLLVIAFYVWFRFEWYYAVSSLATITHDVFLTLGLFSILGLEFDLPSMAAILTIAGYSINDTIVVFDRIRENYRKFRKKSRLEIINLSLNETLSRTVLTSVTTLIAVVTLLIFGGEVIRDFNIALLFGIVVGTYSSVYIASPMLMYIQRKQDVR
ncbi:MAG: protein translocase subunit SecF [Alphaproteobacteria bacterium]